MLIYLFSSTVVLFISSFSFSNKNIVTTIATIYTIIAIIGAKLLIGNLVIAYMLSKTAWLPIILINNVYITLNIPTLKNTTHA